MGLADELVPRRDGLARERFDDARASFTAVYRALPGELAPKLALGMVSESGGGTISRGRRLVRDRVPHRPRVHRRRRSASRAVVSRRASEPDALAAYDRVPDSSSAYVEAQTARIRCLAETNGAGPRHGRRSAGGRLDSRVARGQRRATRPPPGRGARVGARAGRARRRVRRRSRQPARIPVPRARPAVRRRALLQGARPLGGKQFRADRAGRSRQPSSTKDMDMTIEEWT